MKNWLALSLLVMSILALATAQSAQGEVWEENEKEVLVRNERGVNNKNTCRYVKGPWTECDFKTNTRSRSLTLKKGDPTCEQTKTIQKKCKKRGCRYEKSAWSQCKENGEMTRTDTLKDNSDAGCEPNRQITKKCNRNKGAKGGKDKGTRRNRQ